MNHDSKISDKKQLTMEQAKLSLNLEIRRYMVSCIHNNVTIVQDSLCTFIYDTFI